MWLTVNIHQWSIFLSPLSSSEVIILVQLLLLCSKEVFIIRNFCEVSLIPSNYELLEISVH